MKKNEVKLRLSVKQRNLLEILLYKRKPISLGKLADQANYNKSNFMRTLKKLESYSLLRIKDLGQGKETLIRITKTGRSWLKHNPDTADSFEIIPTKKSRIMDLSDTARLIDLLGLNTVTLSADCDPTYTKGVMTSSTGLFKNYGSREELFKKFRHIRSASNIWFTPAETKIIKDSKQLVYSKALWLDIDIDRDENGFPMSNDNRESRLNEVLQNLVVHEILPAAIVDSGAGYHIYFIFQNKLKDPNRMRYALQNLANQFGGDDKVTSPVGNLRLPGSKNIKSTKSRFKTKSECKLIDFRPGNILTLSNVESSLGYNWDEAKWKLKEDHRTSTVTEITNWESPENRRKIKPHRVWAKKTLEYRLKTADYVPKTGDKTFSGRDFGIMVQCILHEYPLDKIMKIFTNPDYMISIINHPENKHNVKYIETTYRNAWNKLTGEYKLASNG